MSNSVRNFSLAAAIALAVVGFSATTSNPAFAYDTASTSAINTGEKALILHGYDAVAYFNQNAAVKGTAKYHIRHEGATYRFSSARNMAAFKANPSKYVPQYGGFCAMGAALGKKLDIDPTQFKVVNDKLYLNVSVDGFKAWSKDIPGNIAKADENWPAIKDVTPASL